MACLHDLDVFVVLKIDQNLARRGERVDYKSCCCAWTSVRWQREGNTLRSRLADIDIGDDATDGRDLQPLFRFIVSVYSSLRICIFPSTPLMRSDIRDHL